MVDPNPYAYQPMPNQGGYAPAPTPAAYQPQQPQMFYPPQPAPQQPPPGGWSPAEAYKGIPQNVMPQNAPQVAQPGYDPQASAQQYNPAQDPNVFQNWFKTHGLAQKYGLSSYDDIDKQAAWTPEFKDAVKSQIANEYVDQVLPTVAGKDKYDIPAFLRKNND